MRGKMEAGMGRRINRKEKKKKIIKIRFWEIVTKNVIYWNLGVEEEWRRKGTRKACVLCGADGKGENPNPIASPTWIYSN